MGDVRVAPVAPPCLTVQFREACHTEVLMKRMFLTFAMVAGVWSHGLAQSPQTGQPVDYETFCKLPDVQTKRSTFVAASPENRAVLVRTQLERWRDANRERLNPKQLAAIADLIAAVTADTYSEGPKGEEARAKTRSLTETHLALFTPDQVQAMQPNAPCIAKVK